MQFATHSKLDRDLFQYAARGARSVFTPLQMFARIPQNQFADKAKKVLSAVVSGRASRDV